MGARRRCLSGSCRRDRIHRPGDQRRRCDHGLRLPVLLLGDERTLKEFGFGLAVAVFLDAIVVRCVLLPAVLELLGPCTWRLPRGWTRGCRTSTSKGSAARRGRRATSPSTARGCGLGAGALAPPTRRSSPRYSGWARSSCSSCAGTKPADRVVLLGRGIDGLARPVVDDPKTRMSTSWSMIRTSGSRGRDRGRRHRSPRAPRTSSRASATGSDSPRSTCPPGRSHRHGDQRRCGERRHSSTWPSRTSTAATIAARPDSALTTRSDRASRSCT